MVAHAWNHLTGAMRRPRRPRSAAAASAPPARPQRRAGDDRPEDRAERQAAQERRGRPVVVAARSCAVAPTGRGSRPPTRSPIPIQATTEAASRWKSPIVRRSNPSRSARASPAHAPRIDASDDDRQPPAGAAPDEHEQRRVEDADEDGQDERRIEAHAPRRRRSSRRRCPVGDGDAGADLTGATGPAIRPPPSTTSPSYRTAAWPGAAAQTGLSRLDQPAAAAGRLRRGRRTDGGRDRRRAVPDPDLGTERRPAAWRVAGDEGHPLERRSSSSRGPRDGRA